MINLTQKMPQFVLGRKFFVREYASSLVHILHAKAPVGAPHQLSQ